MIKDLLEFNNSPNWKLFAEKDNLMVYSYIGSHGIICIKGVTLFPFDVDTIYDFLETDKWANIESMVEWTKVIEDNGFNTFVCHTKTKKFLIAQSWDWVAVAHAAFYNNGDTLIMPSKSIEHP